MTLTHGMSGTPAHASWRAMLDRCRRQKCAAYKNYGGRGITVCERWESFENFLADMGHRPEGKELDRIDNDGNYEPGNCRWATTSEQALNRRSVAYAVIDGERKPLVHWAAQNGLKAETAKARYRKGWPAHRAASAPLRVPASATIDGQTKSIRQWCAIYGVRYPTVWHRIARRGIDPKTALTLPIQKGRHSHDL